MSRSNDDTCIQSGQTYDIRKKNNFITMNFPLPFIIIAINLIRKTVKLVTDFTSKKLHTEFIYY